MRHEKEFQAALHCNASLRFDNGYVYIEVPTGTETVFLGDMLIDNEYQSTDGFTMAIGMAVDGSKHYIDIAKACHILISGMTGSGKSIILHNLILSLLMKKNPAQMHLYIIDPKATEFEYYKNLAACTVVSEVNGAVELLKNLCICLLYTSKGKLFLKCCYTCFQSFYCVRIRTRAGCFPIIKCFPRNPGKTTKALYIRHQAHTLRRSILNI